jgi:hypothetical protein
MLYLHYAHPLSYERVQTILRDMTGLKLGIGTLVNIVKRGQPLYSSGQRPFVSVASRPRWSVQTKPVCVWRVRTTGSRCFRPPDGLLCDPTLAGGEDHGGCDG